MSSSGEEDDRQSASQEWDEWEEDDEGEEQAQSLFSDALLPTPEAALEHDATHHGFDLREYRQQLSLDEYDVIRVINYVRRQVAAGADPRPALAAAAAAATQQQQPGAQTPLPPWAGDDMLVPVLPDDALLAFALEEGLAAFSIAGGGDGGAVEPPPSSTSRAAAAGGAEASNRLAALEAENEALRLRLEALVEALAPPELAEAARSDAVAAGAHHRNGGDGGAGTSTAAAGAKATVAASLTAAPPAGVIISAATPQDGRRRATAAAVDAAYYDSYSTFGIHREMLADAARTQAYRDALERNPALIKGAAVLDVGCGTGVLSMFAARGGAAAVVGVDGSARIAGVAAANVAANALGGSDSGGPVRIVHGRVEELAAPGAPPLLADDAGSERRFDVLVSEWMGYALLFESMLGSVLAARDRWLRPGGALLPDVATVHVAGASAAAFDLDFWRDVYGLSMAPVADELAAAGAGIAHVCAVPASALLTAPAQVVRLDLATMTPGDQDFSAEFELAAVEGGGAGQDVAVAAIVLWFDVEFSARFCAEHPVTLLTSPAATTTHWVQTLLPLRMPLALPSGGGGSPALRGRLSMARSRAAHRCLDISLEVAAADGAGGWGLPDVALYKMQVGGGAGNDDGGDGSGGGGGGGDS